MKALFFYIIKNTLVYKHTFCNSSCNHTDTFIRAFSLALISFFLLSHPLLFQWNEYFNEEIQWMAGNKRHAWNAIIISHQIKHHVEFTNKMFHHRTHNLIEKYWTLKKINFNWKSNIYFCYFSLEPMSAILHLVWTLQSKSFLKNPFSTLNMWYNISNYNAEAAWIRIIFTSGLQKNARFRSWIILHLGNLFVFKKRKEKGGRGIMGQKANEAFTKKTCQWRISET